MGFGPGSTDELSEPMTDVGFANFGSESVYGASGLWMGKKAFGCDSGTVLTEGDAGLGLDPGEPCASSVHKVAGLRTGSDAAGAVLVDKVSGLRLESDVSGVSGRTGEGEEVDTGLGSQYEA